MKTGLKVTLAVLGTVALAVLTFGVVINVKIIKNFRKAYIRKGYTEDEAEQLGLTAYGLYMEFVRSKYAGSDEYQAYLEAAKGDEAIIDDILDELEPLIKEQLPTGEE